MNCKVFLLILGIFLCFPLVTFSQYYTSGEDPASLKWNKIETDNFKLVFPSGYIGKAQYLAKVFEEVYKYGSESLNHQPKKISVLIHPETSYSNGFVSWAPKRIELFPTPNQQMHAQEWLQQLAMHEFRHVVQIDKLNTGFTKILSYVLGEQAVGAVLGLNVPMWFLEGDAVAAETALSKSGRGRSPWFEQRIRAQIMEKGIYSYDKAYFGSYRDFTPNYYEMGYQLVAGARARYGAQIWEEALFNTGRNSMWFYPFSNGIINKIGYNKDQLYKNVFAGLHKDWESQDGETVKTNFQLISKRNDAYINFKYPLVTEEGNIIAEISGPGEITRFVKIDSLGNYSTIFTPGQKNDEPFSYGNHVVCWAEYTPDARWENQAWSVIKCFDLSNSKLSVVTKKSRYFAPEISPDGKFIAAVKVSTDNKYNLVIVDRFSGKEVKEFVNNASDYIMSPSWNMNGDEIVYISLSDKGKRVCVVGANGGDVNDVVVDSYQDIRYVSWKDNNTILLTAGFSGTEEIYAVDRGSKEVKQLTQSQYGCSHAVFNNHSGEIVFNTYTADGFMVAKASEGDLLNVPLSRVSNHSKKLYHTISKQESGQPDFISIDTIQDYQVKKYSKWNLFNFHSWAPAFISINDEVVNAGLSTFSQNLLGTAITSVGYNADSQKKLEKYHFNFQYRGFYPVFEVDVKHGDDKVVYDGLYGNDNEAFYLLANEKIHQTQIEAGLKLPLNLTKNKYYSLLQPSVDYNFFHRSGYEINRTEYTQGINRWIPVQGSESIIYNSSVDYSTMEYGLYYHHLMKRSERDVTTRWGQLFQLNYQSTPFNGIDAGSIWGFSSRLYFPGFLKHHSVRVDNEYQTKLKGEEYDNGSTEIVAYRTLGDYVNFARGYGRYANNRLYSFKADYIFPLCNPDISLPGILYLKRITSNVFFDYTKGWQEITDAVTRQNNTASYELKSLGVEFRGEVHVLRFIYPLSVGYRYARLLDINSNHHEFLLGLNISGFSVGKK
ncbi:hypothetical protein [Plebeiibacterium marinum]|uniref:Uncharacterized protein n=1 Tax=Plebeiibacterium marinum TaxID=2992111 RepID=A0AAE3SKU8_9BACT|nr:hypothetical protein [Plebeiobacterium marinum]MCW3805900.1 hypothetical protein [Plebeiobacterium marinum]